MVEYERDAYELVSQLRKQGKRAGFETLRKPDGNALYYVFTKEK